jgi:nucleoside 2-deoxyribosyltransferase
MVCFVASAFDQKDVDAIYDEAIRPALRELKIRCTRVDRVEHNDDIDDKIFALMNAADFCIADLTYARPSVYYEAGYMFGCRKPVIYISRNDHFHTRASDPHGNLRLHFDLQNKEHHSLDRALKNIRSTAETEDFNRSCPAS